ncbi:MAG: hypothetical protein KJO91_08950 [Gammaproteobacteria bacterium]|nr:hypothetical protein [Gammaproteobacteria bacterium]
MADPTVVLAKATGAGNSAEFTVSNVPLHVKAYPVANMAAETGVLKEKNPDGTFDAVYLTDGTAIALGATLPSVLLNGGGPYRVEYAARTSAVGVTIQENKPR